MSAFEALLAQQPAAFWLAVVGVLTAAAIASGRRLAVRSALAVLAAVVVAAVAPRALAAQAAAAILGVVAVAAPTLVLAWRARARRPSTRRAAQAAADGDHGARLLGRTARARAPFVAGEGEVEIDGELRRAQAQTPHENLAAGALVRIVRVGAGGLVVRPLQPSSAG